MKLLLTIALLFIPTLTSHDDSALIEAAKHSEVVVVAEVVEVHPSPGYWSGVVASVQHVRYKVLETLRGDVKRSDIDAGHYVVANSLTADRKAPQLSPTLFKLGNHVVLMLSRERGHGCRLDQVPDEIEAFCSRNENTGATLASSSLIRTLRESRLRK
jgi:hypothetical protein